MTEAHWWSFAFISFLVFMCLVFILADQDVGWAIAGIIWCGVAYYLLFTSPMKGDMRDRCVKELPGVTMTFMQNEKPYIDESGAHCVKWKKQVLTEKGWRDSL